MRAKIILMLVISSLIVGCIDNTNKNNLSDEQKLIGTWNFKNNLIEIKFIFNQDGSGTFTHSDFGKYYFKYQLFQNKKYVCTSIDCTKKENRECNNGSCNFYKIHSRVIEFSDIKPNTGGMWIEEKSDYEFINDKILIILGMSFDKSWW